jgi:hypothetical protein
MADSFQLHIDGLDELNAALAQLQAETPRILQTAMDETLRYLRQELPPYPGGQAGPLPRIYERVGKHGPYRSKFKTRKQQGYFFAALGAGRITLPYTRTGTLRKTMHIESTANANEVIGKIGPNVPYGAYVIGNDTQQAPLHQGRWWQLADEVEKNLDDAARVLEEAAWRAIRDTLKE